MNPAGKTALVTGSGRRVGRAIALELARSGCDVLVHYHRSASEAQGTAADVRALGRRAEAVCADLSKPDEWDPLVHQAVGLTGRLDVLVNNASIFPTDFPDTLESMNVGFWEQMLRVNLLAPVGLVRAAVPHLKASGGGVVINLLDISTAKPWSNHLAYCVSKGGLETATRALARALAPDVRVNGIAPGIAVFPESYGADLRERLAARVPIGRTGTPEDISRAARFLVESGDFVTGQVLRIDGGRSVA
ncbi:MAG: SDR family oxidoreductase [Phycisphaerae bacterium]|nr:SDR family oxidoreductase [Phycisphaerae bacterium]